MKVDDELPVPHHSGYVAAPADQRAVVRSSEDYGVGLRAIGSRLLARLTND